MLIRIQYYKINSVITQKPSISAFFFRILQPFPKTTKYLFGFQRRRKEAFSIPEKYTHLSSRPVMPFVSVNIVYDQGAVFAGTTQMRFVRRTKQIMTRMTSSVPYSGPRIVFVMIMMTRYAAAVSDVFSQVVLSFLDVCTHDSFRRTPTPRALITCVLTVFPVRSMTTSRDVMRISDFENDHVFTIDKK